MGAAAGAAVTGLRPVAELMFSDFFGVCFDQIYNQAAKFRYMFGGKAKTPLVIRTMIGAGRSAAAQHSQSPYHIFTSVPGLKCVVPSNAYDAKGLLIQAIRDDDPVIFCEHKLMYDLRAEVPDEPYTIPFGEANIVRDGGDVTVVALARMVHYAGEAAEALASHLMFNRSSQEGAVRRALDIQSQVEAAERRRQFGADNPKASEIERANERVQALLAERETSEAKELIDKLVQTSRQLLGDDDPVTLRVMTTFGDAPCDGISRRGARHLSNRSRCSSADSRRARSRNGILSKETRRTR